MSGFIISLDFEMFWGVTSSRTIPEYGANVRANWQTIPKLLEIFSKHNVHVTWATVGMLLCKDYDQWLETRPTLLPEYARAHLSNYDIAQQVREYPELFFARPLAEQVLQTPGQELGCHTYSHFYCGEEGAGVAQFDADLQCAHDIFAEIGVKPVSLVFPRNQVRQEYVDALPKHGFTSYRGNPAHWLYRDGHVVASAFHPIYRILRMADSCLPLTGHHLYSQDSVGQALCNIPCSRFLRPITGNSVIDGLHTNMLKQGMLAAAKKNKIFHLWAHPHNFGKHSEANLERLDALLAYFNTLRDDYGMESYTMKEMVAQCKAA